ncbi:DUF2510 domain-containing protein [Streptomyces sp. G45]|uniref:DUF2510 domain-containing protein n=1 Tax=Streptomyces sp. G45 TaxID=3406627 RepID=UPI003C24D159
MTHATPPGWYPDPRQAPGAPPSERWWDGSKWTDHVRAPGAAPAPPGPFPAPYPGPPPHDPRRRRIRTAIGVGVAVAVLAGIGGGVYALTADDDGDDDAGSPSSSAPVKPGPDDGDGDSDGDSGDGGDKSPGNPEGSPSPGPSDAPPSEEGYATDRASGISVPVPDGWEGQSGRGGVGASVTTGKYPCPGETSKTCVRGGAFSAPARAMKVTGSSPEAVAKADIEKNAEESYGGPIYGGTLKSHKELASRSVTVAGQKGYLVRWKAVTRKGPDGYVQSLAFTSPTDDTTLVLVRFGIDVHDDAPPLSSMDRIAKGIKAARGGAGGDGQQVNDQGAGPYARTGRDVSAAL